MGQIPWKKVKTIVRQYTCSLIVKIDKILISACQIFKPSYTKNQASPLSNYGDPGILLVGGCSLADGSKRQGHRLVTEEER